MLIKLNEDGLIHRLNGEQLSAWQLALRPQNEAFARSSVEMDGFNFMEISKVCKKLSSVRLGLSMKILEGFMIFYIQMKGDSWTFIYTACSGNFVGENGWLGGAWMEPTMRIPLLITGEDYGENRICHSYVQLLDLFQRLQAVSNQK